MTAPVQDHLQVEFAPLPPDQVAAYREALRIIAKWMMELAAEHPEIMAQPVEVPALELA